MKVLVIDTETTGLNHQFASLWELACIVLDEDLKFVKKFEIRVCPPKKIMENVSLKSLQISGVTKDELYNFISFKQGSQKFINFLKDEQFVLVGYNLEFDIEFIKDFLAVNGVSFFKNFHYNRVADVFKFVKLLYSIGIITEVPNLKLTTIVKYFDMYKGEKFHSAMDDTILTARLFKRIYNFFIENNISKESFMKKN